MELCVQGLYIDHTTLRQFKAKRNERERFVMKLQMYFNNNYYTDREREKDENRQTDR